MIEAISLENLDSSLALEAIKSREKVKDLNGAFEIAKQVLIHDFSQNLLERAALLAHQLQCVEKLEETLQSSKKLLRRLSKKPGFSKELRQLGLLRLAIQLEQSSHINQ